MALEPNIWGPHYWFVLHTIALTYPKNPNSVIKKKYYDFIHNLPLFLPIESIGNQFSTLIDKYPVTPYLDSRASFIRWMHFIHNKINIITGKPTIKMDEAMSNYYELYKPKAVKNDEERKKREKIIFFSITSVLIVVSTYLYNA